MRRVACLGLLLLGAALAPACDSDSPLQVGAQEFELFVSAPSALVPRLSVWEFGEDLTGDGAPDDVDGDGEVDLNLWCVPFAELNGAAPPSASSMPWGFYTRIEILRAGQTVRELLTSPLAADSPISQAGYDTNSESGSIIQPDILLSHPAGQCSDNTAIACDPNLGDGYCGLFQATGGGADAGSCTAVAAPAVDRRFVFRNAEIPSSPFQTLWSQANRRVLAQRTHFLFELTGGTAGLCPGIDLGDPQIDGSPQPFAVTLNKGDTIIVTIGKSEIPPGVGFVGSGPNITAQLLLDGAGVTVNGTSSTNTSRDNFSFNFTTR